MKWMQYSWGDPTDHVWRSIKLSAYEGQLVLTLILVAEVKPFFFLHQWQYIYIHTAQSRKKKVQEHLQIAKHFHYYFNLQGNWNITKYFDIISVSGNCWHIPGGDGALFCRSQTKGHLGKVLKKLMEIRSSLELSTENHNEILFQINYTF